MVRPGDARPGRSLKSRFGEAGRWISGVLGVDGGKQHPVADRESIASTGGATPGAAIEMPFNGQWLTTYGPMSLAQIGNSVSGSYGEGNTLSGTVADGRLDFTYREADEAGSGWFQHRRFGAFEGQYVADGADLSHSWKATRGFDGLWDTSFGRMRLRDHGDRIEGTYNGAGRATITGRREGDRFAFRYQEPKVGGEGWFAIDGDMSAFSGQWRADGAAAWEDWTGKRVVPQAGREWLVVLEAHWQAGIAEPDFAFGFMLRELFARLPRVAVRHRFFDGAQGLLHLCEELTYIAEPVVLVITSHGEPDGVSVGGAIIDTQRILSALSTAETLRLLHFSCCLIGQDAHGVLASAPFPVSGYLTSVDWAQSAMTEFIYLDMILGKHLSPPEAANQLVRLVAFAGDGEIENSPYASAGFRIFGIGSHSATEIA